MDPISKEKIQQLKQKANQYHQEGHYKQSLDTYQQLLDLYKNVYGTESQQYQSTSVKICQLCNIIAIILLQKEKFDLCAMFLKKGESYSLKNPQFTAVTYNNYACYYKKTGKLRTALMYLQSALQLEWKSKNQKNLADTYLNLCAVLSQLGRHTEALENVLFSITLLQQEIAEKQSSSNPDRISVLAIAYHNMGVQLQYLKRIDESISAYQKGYKVAQKHLKQGNDLVQKLRNIVQNARSTGQNTSLKQRKFSRNLQKDKLTRITSNYQHRQRPKTGKKSVVSKAQNKASKLMDL